MSMLGPEAGWLAFLVTVHFIYEGSASYLTQSLPVCIASQLALETLSLSLPLEHQDYKQTTVSTWIWCGCWHISLDILFSQSRREMDLFRLQPSHHPSWEYGLPHCPSPKTQVTFKPRFLLGPHPARL